MPQQHHIIHELSRTVADEKDLISDAVGLLPAISSRAAPAIRDRFLHRLSKLTASTINMVEHESQSFVELRLQRNSGVPQVPVEEDKDLQTFLRRMANSMAIISKHRSGMYTVSTTMLLLA
jgi:nitrogen-specific signal transduction histidine kinase